jgi:hypothetical protein
MFLLQLGQLEAEPINKRSIGDGVCREHPPCAARQSGRSRQLDREDTLFDGFLDDVPRRAR